MNTGLSDYVNEDLGRWSDLLFGTAIGIYVVAMLLFLTALAGARGRALPETAAEKELVAAGAGSAARGRSTALGDRTPGRVAGPQAKRPLGDRLSAMAYPVVWVGFAAHVASIVVRGIATDRAPWGNMYEFISLTCAACMLAALFFLRKPAQRPLLGIVLIPVALLMFIAGKWLYATAAPVVPALKSYWLLIHVSIISTGSGVLLVSGVASILYLIKVRWGATAAAHEAEDETATGFSPAVIGRRIVDHLPSADSLDRLAYKCVVVGFPLFGLGIVFGAIWAESSWGRFWGWDPKETVSFIAWIIFAAYLHARATAGWRNAAAWVNVAGFVALMFNLFAINLVVSGLHSYAGL
ncbi:MAG: c-type cytochrome biogenesis protein CcsB [Gordonia sp. (in: high G+C Gram-positive bacteria)]|uniref:c-type cytochrome biogenesis protein CcsB n=1 Tax=Gordonia sp. (in: high G+C Gram-positive bacteria) TaxID=84139 RepID=UPI0039E26857